MRDGTAEQRRGQIIQGPEGLKQGVGGFILSLKRSVQSHPYGRAAYFGMACLKLLQSSRL